MRATRNSTVDRHGDPLVALRGDIAAIKKDLTSLVGSRIGAVGEAVVERMNGTNESARKLVARARKSAGAAHDRLGDAAGARPLTTIAVAAVAGIVGAKVLGWMMRR